MPLWKHYTDQMKKSPLADLNNISLTPGNWIVNTLMIIDLKCLLFLVIQYSTILLGGGSCTAAAFLREFTQCKNWMHLDIAGEKDIPTYYFYNSF